jgi:hypothetical protein
MKKITSFNILSLLAVGIVFLYMWQWRAMPLYPDEIAAFIVHTRTFIDGGIRYGLFATCQSNAKVVPLFFYPAAFVVAEIGAFPDWGLIRIIPFLAVAALMGAVFLFNKKVGKSAYIPFFFTAGFMGVAGSGIILLRPEAYLVLHGAICLTAYSYSADGSPPRTKALVLLITLYAGSLISYFVHPQGLILAPATLLLMCRLSKSFDKLSARLITILAITYFFLAVLYGNKLGGFRCDENSKIAEFISAMTLLGWLNSSNPDYIADYLKTAFVERLTYFDKFLFRPHYQIDYLPPLHISEPGFEWFVRLVNIAIGVVSGLIVLGFILLCFYLLFRIIMRLPTLLRQPASWPDKLRPFALSNEVIFLTICWAHLSLLVVVTQLNFYRVFYLNLAMVVLLLIALSQAKNQLAQKTISTMGISSFLLCTASVVVTNQFFSPKLEAGYAGPSIPLGTDWGKMTENVHALKNMCDISDNESDVIIDDMTYDSLRKHQHLIPITYIGLSEVITGISAMGLIRNSKAKAAVARCGYFNAHGIPIKGTMGELCCTTF